MADVDAPERDALADSAARLLATAQALTDDDLRQASALPGWTRAHVLTHLAQGTDSRTGLLRAARAGQVGRQYPSEQARAEAVDAGARRPPAVIRADLQRAVQEGLTAIGEHPGHLWDAPAITLGAGRRPVRDIVTSLRRELEYHHVDLAAGYQPADWPDDFAATELSIVTAWMNSRADAPPMTLTGPSALRIDTSPPVDVTGRRRRCWRGCLVAVTAVACTRTLGHCQPSRQWVNPAVGLSGYTTGGCPPPLNHAEPRYSYILDHA